MLCVVNVCPVYAVELIDSTWVFIVPGQKCIHTHSTFTTEQNQLAIKASADNYRNASG